MITVYVQIRNSAIWFTDFTGWREPERQKCQQIADRMRCEVRAFRGQKQIGRFLPKLKELIKR